MTSDRLGDARPAEPKDRTDPAAAGLPLLALAVSI
jgi:hypothetical protein